ncbi:hypothetical protein LCL97_17385 [Seohaeicola saemankumensis]|nr:hypothetical protein [Seohaeicola saemankumensis]MCA0872610.1 hypothetical protein [Seohaeicola saemankumensis]
MSDLILTKIRMRNGVWEGRITGAGTTGVRPDVKVTLMDQPVEGVTLEESSEAGIWDLAIEVPSHAIADGVQTFLIFDAANDIKLGDFTLIAGEALADDLRAEVELLRAELDMLKRAFRRHCLETM